MEGISLGSAYLRLYGDRSALDRELEKLKRYTDYLEKQGIKVKFDADTGKANREINGLQYRLNQLQETIGQVGQGVRGDGEAWKGLADNLAGVAGKAADGGGAMGKMAGMVGTAGAAATKAIPILGQLGMAAMGVQAIFQGLSGAINGVISPLAALSQEAGRFNQQVAEASIFATNSFSVFGPDGKAIQGTANQMRALRGTISKEYREIQKEVAQISGATASQIYEGFNIILQNVGALGKEGEDLGNVRKLATRLAAGMNTLNVPGEQLRSEMQSLLTGDVQMYDKLGKDLYGANASQTIKRLQAEGKYYEDLMSKLEKLYDGQKVLSESLTNVQSNFSDVFQTIGAEASQALERGLAKALKAVLNPLDDLQGSFMGFARATNEFLEPIMRILGEIGGWFVSVGSAVASTLQIVMDILALGANVIGSVLGPALRGIGKILTVVAKGFELIAAVVSSLLRPISTFFRIIGDQDNQAVDNVFDPIIEGLDTLIGYAETAARVIARPFVELAKWQAWTKGKLSGKSDEQIAGEQDEVEAEFAKSIGQSGAPSLRSLKLLRPTEDLLREIGERYGSGSARQLQISKETSQLVQDRLKNEITGMEQVTKQLQVQRGLQESMNQLADARRGIAMSRASFSVQVAGSPEARLAAEERKNELAARQEQERINERKALLGTERQMLQLQLQIQLRQQRMQQEQLKIQRAEIEIQRNKAENAARDVVAKLNNAATGSKEAAGLREQWRLLGREIQLRDQQLSIMKRTVSLAFEAESGLRRTNALEEQRLGVQGQVLDVQGQATNLTLEQQQTLSRLQRQEQELKNQLADQQRQRNDLIKAAEQELQTLQRQEKAQQGLRELERARMENRKAAADLEVQAAEQQLRAVQAREGASSGRDYLAAQIEAIAAGTRGYVSEADATRRLYDAKASQMELEQAMQREQLRIQQERERSELRIAGIQLRITELQTLNLQTELQFRRQQLGLQQQRDSLAGSGASTTGAPSAPVLPSPAGGSAIPGGARTNRTRDPDAEKTGWDIVMPGGRGAAVRAPVALTITGTGFQGRGAGSSGKGYGNWISGEFQLGGKTYELLLGHFDRVDVARGMQVPAGGQLGTQGITGRTFGTHVTTHVNPKGGATVADGWNALEAVTRTWERGASGGMATSATQAATRPSSLGNDLLQNTSDLVRVERDLSRVRQEQVEVQGQEAQLAERQGLSADTLGSNQNAQRAQLETDRLRAQLTAEVLNSFKGRLAVSVADAFAGGMAGAVRGVFASVRGGGSITDAINGAMEQMADQAFDAILTAALKPMQDAIYDNILGGILGDDLKAAEQQVVAQQQQAAQGLQAAGQQQQTAAQGLSGAGQTLLSAGQSLQVAAQAITSAAASGQAGQAATAASAGSSPPSGGDTAGKEAANAAADAAENAKKQAKEAEATNDKQKELQKALAGATQAFAGVALAVSGIEQIGKGGTYNTLMGLASIFGSIGSFASMFAGFKAEGGPVASGKAYWVGEEGPELFFPGASGQIVSNPKSQALMAGASTPWTQTRQMAANPFQSSRAAADAQQRLSSPFDETRASVLGQQEVARQQDGGRALAEALSSPADPLRVAFESTRINEVEYVTVDQFMRGMKDSAERGRALTLGTLKNSVKTRRMVGL